MSLKPRQSPRTTSSRPRICCVGVAVVAGLTPAMVSSEPLFPSWDFEPGVRLSLFYDDNVRLSAVDPESSFAGIAEVYALMSRRTEVTDLSFRAAADTRYYVDLTELNTTDGALDAAYTYRMERATFGLSSSFAYDSTLTSEEETTGIVQISRRRSFFDITPSVEYELSERSRIGADFTFQDVSYEDVSAVLLSDYQFYQVGLNGEYDLTERLTALARLGYDDFQSELAGDSSEAISGEAGVRYRFSDRMTVTARAGARSVSSDTDLPVGRGSDDNSTGPIYGIGFEREYGPGLLRVSLDRELLPTGRATLLDTTRARVSFSLPVSERATASLDALGVRNRSPSGDDSFDDREFLSISPSLRWNLGETTWLDLSYRFRYQDRERLAEDAQSNAVFFGFGHDWAVR
jgi:hypothetical protein